MRNAMLTVAMAGLIAGSTLAFARPAAEPSLNTVQGRHLGTHERQDTNDAQPAVHGETDDCPANSATAKTVDGPNAAKAGVDPCKRKPTDQHVSEPAGKPKTDDPR